MRWKNDENIINERTRNGRCLLCGVHIANAQTNIDTGYTITIPSEVGIDKDSGKGSFVL